MLAVRERIDEFGDTEIVLVTFTRPNLLAAYVERHDLAFPVLVDPAREVYRTYGYRRGSVRRVWGWRAAKRYVELFRSGGIKGLRRPVEDTLQLGGDVVISPDGALAYAFHGDGPDDRPSIDELLDAVDRARGRV